MTTIACDGKTMSSDSRETAGDVIVGSKTIKLFMLDAGSVLGAAGRAAQIQKFIAWLNDGNEDSRMPTLKEVTALILHADGTCEMFEDGVFMDQELPAAIGTGSVFALTAMDMGGTTAKAVQMAIKRDVYSGGKVQTMKPVA